MNRFLSNTNSVYSFTIQFTSNMRGSQVPHPFSKKSKVVKRSNKPFVTVNEQKQCENDKKAERAATLCVPDDMEFTSTVAKITNRGLSYNMEGILGIKFSNLRKNQKKPANMDIQFLIDWTRG